MRTDCSPENRKTHRATHDEVLEELPPIRLGPELMVFKKKRAQHVGRDKVPGRLSPTRFEADSLCYHESHEPFDREPVLEAQPRLSQCVQHGAFFRS